MKTCKDYWQNEKTYLKEMLSFFNKDLHQITFPLHDIEIVEEEGVDNQTMYYNNATDEFQEEYEIDILPQPIPKEIKDLELSLYNIHFEISLISLFEGYYKQAISSMQQATNSTSIALGPLNELEGKGLQSTWKYLL